MRPTGVVLAFFITGLGSGCTAESAHSSPPRAADRTPSATIMAFFSDIQRHEWDSAAALADPGWAHSFQQSDMLELALSAETVGKTPEGGGTLTQIPTDTAVIKRILAQHGGSRLQGIPGVHTLNDLAALPPLEYLARDFALMHGAWARDTTDPSLEYHLIGEMTATDTTAYVLLQCPDQGCMYSFNEWEPIVLSLHRVEGSWRYRLPRAFTFPSLATELSASLYHAQRH